jgi:hypothetical protein
MCIGSIFRRGDNHILGGKIHFSAQFPKELWDGQCPDFEVRPPPPPSRPPQLPVHIMYEEERKCVHEQLTILSPPFYGHLIMARIFTSHFSYFSCSIERKE